MLTQAAHTMPRARLVQSNSRGNLGQIVVPVPPLPEQERIVAAIEEQFSRLDAGIAALGTGAANSSGCALLFSQRSTWGKWNYKVQSWRPALSGRETRLGVHAGRTWSQLGLQLSSRMETSANRQVNFRGLKYIVRTFGALPANVGCRAAEGPAQPVGTIGRSAVVSSGTAVSNTRAHCARHPSSNGSNLAMWRLP